MSIKGSGRKKTIIHGSTYLDFGFTVVKRKVIEHSQCVICCKVVAGDCMLPSTLKRHITVIQLLI